MTSAAQDLRPLDVPGVYPFMEEIIGEVHLTDPQSNRIREVVSRLSIQHPPFMIHPTFRIYDRALILVIRCCVRDRVTGKPVSVMREMSIARDHIAYLTTVDEEPIKRLARVMLEAFFVHEALESLRFDGELVCDPHAGEG